MILDAVTGPSLCQLTSPLVLPESRDLSFFPSLSHPVLRFLGSLMFRRVPLTFKTWPKCHPSRKPFLPTHFSPSASSGPCHLTIHRVLGSCSDFNPGQSSKFRLGKFSFFIYKVVPIIGKTIPCRSLWAELVRDHRCLNISVAWDSG